MRNLKKKFSSIGTVVPRTLKSKRLCVFSCGFFNCIFLNLFSFSHASTLAEHTNLHNSLKPFQCNICLQSFAQRKGLRAHRCSSNQEVDPQSANQFFPCPYCNRQFSSRRGEIRFLLNLKNNKIIKLDK